MYLASTEPSPIVERCLAVPLARVTDAPAETFGSVYDAYARFVWRTLVRLGVHDRDVEDVVQEVFLVVHRRQGEFRQESTLRTWIYGIAVHVARNYRRTRTRRPHASAGFDANAEADSLPEAVDRGPDALLAKAEAAQLLVGLLQELDQDSREVFVLAELEEMTAVEIGEVLKLSPNTVSSRLRAARRSFDEAVRRNRARDEWRIR